eukprot:11082798-Heterocapsa_arctica.AAC.1
MPGGTYIPPGAREGTGWAGARESTGPRLTTNLCACTPTDPRNTAVGRPGKKYDAVIILKKSVLSAFKIRMNHNGVLSTEDTIPWRYIDLIYLTPSDGNRWVIYDHRLAPMSSE